MAADRTALITKIYKDQFGRAPDAAGLAYWLKTSAGMSDKDLTDNISYSASQQAPAAAAGPVKASVNVTSPAGAREALINQIYYQELGKTSADKAGLDYWNKSGLDEAGLRANIRNSAGVAGNSVVQPLMQDQDFAAFMRKMQFNETETNANLLAAKDAAKRRIQGQAGQYDMQREGSQQNIQSGYESRGMQRAGGRVTDINKGRTAIDMNQRQFEDGVHEATATAERQAGSSIADARRQRAEEEVAARNRLTVKSQQAGV